MDTPNKIILLTDFIEQKVRKEKGDYNNHPTVKPISLMSYLVKIYSSEKNTVLDQFCGSGTTGVSCIKENRNFLGIDMSEEYVKISNKRCKEHASE